MQPKKTTPDDDVPAYARRHSQEIASHSDKLTDFEERISALESKFRNRARDNLALAQLCEELGYNVRTIAEHVQLPLPLLVNPGGPFFEPDDIG